MLQQHQVEHYQEAGYLEVLLVERCDGRARAPGASPVRAPAPAAHLQRRGRGRYPHRFRLPPVSRTWVQHAHLQTSTRERALQRSRMYA